MRKKVAWGRERDQDRRTKNKQQRDTWKKEGAAAERRSREERQRKEKQLWETEFQKKTEQRRKMGQHREEEQPRWKEQQREDSTEKREVAGRGAAYTGGAAMNPRENIPRKLEMEKKQQGNGQEERTEQPRSGNKGRVSETNKIKFLDTNASKIKITRSLC
jgi:hypothetical protein